VLIALRTTQRMCSGSSPSSTRRAGPLQDQSHALCNQELQIWRLEMQRGVGDPVSKTGCPSSAIGKVRGLLVRATHLINPSCARAASTRVAATTGKACACGPASRVASSGLHYGRQWTERDRAMRSIERYSRVRLIESRVVSPNNRMQRGVTHKVPRRGRDTVPPNRVRRARVRDTLCSRADAGRYASQ
jgi:hypothetical protein